MEEEKEKTDEEVFGSGPANMSGTSIPVEEEDEEEDEEKTDEEIFGSGPANMSGASGPVDEE